MSRGWTIRARALLIAGAVAALVCVQGAVAAAHSDRPVLTLGVVVVAALVAAALIWWGLARPLLDDVEDLVDTADRIAAGDWSGDPAPCAAQETAAVQAALLRGRAVSRSFATQLADVQAHHD